MSPGFPVRIHKEPYLRRSSLVVGWRGEAGNLGERATGYLNRKLKGHEFAEIDPEGFFPLGGVAIEDDLARFPESKFCVCPEHELVLFQSDSPRAEWYRFLSSVLDVAERHCQVEQICILGAMVSFSAHTTPRQLFAVFGSAQTKEAFAEYDLITDMDYQTPPGERPTLNSFLLWMAKERNIPGVSLWAPIPYYLATTEDTQAQKKVLSLLDKRLNLKIDFGDLNQEIQEQNEKLAGARSLFPKIDDYIRRLESNLMLSDEENGELIRRIEDSLRERG